MTDTRAPFRPVDDYPTEFPPAVRIDDDRSGSFAPLRGRLLDQDRRSYVAFVQSLTANYHRVWRDIAFGYVALAATVLAVAVLSRWVWPPLLVAFGALGVGYWFAYLQLFLHEGAHFNLHSDRSRSDMFCNALIGWMIGTDIASYRVVHWQHHRKIGTVEDSEFTYFFPLNLLFMIRCAFGIRAIEVFLARHRMVQSGKVAATTSGREQGPGRSPQARTVLVVGLALHALIAIGLALVSWTATASWIIGVAIVFPLLGALRQLLEHRDPSADPETDYARSDHGAYTRIFGDGPLASTFGGAGFNRHLLHHWEPQVSYTRLPDLERFLMRTEIAPVLEARRTTYIRAFRELFRW
ncbi:fatty acid desaturase [Bradyrhizobium sp. Tv2a-2]|uniref:fatty acid desaturase family protein n=1 Tax=Bradyrhizobium sp. Tv2a-2 TaxID=113395 RepID=UPI0004189EE9|nr:fatty acid desaturase [Bradyrhizobium sp. Tv2a-2]